MTGQELTKLWELYPEARNLYEQYNGILAEDDASWKECTDTAVELILGGNTGLREAVILETVRQLEYIARKRAG